jgi:hypothetical protein
MATLMRRIRETLIDEPQSEVSPNTIVLSVVDQLQTGQIETPAVPTRPAAPPPTMPDSFDPPTNLMPNLAASPATIKMVLRPNRLQVSPGRKVTAEIILLNTGGTPISVWLRVEEMSTWMQLNQETLNLRPGTQQSVQAVISLPFDSSATAGQHHVNAVYSPRLCPAQ